MNEIQPRGSAAPALAAHSKDGAAVGQTPASNTMGKNAEPAGMSDTISGLSDKVHEGVEHAKAAVRDAVGSARETVSAQGGRAVDQASDFIREQPLIAVAVTGAICFALGMLFSRR